MNGIELVPAFSAEDQKFFDELTIEFGLDSSEHPSKDENNTGYMELLKLLNNDVEDESKAKKKSASKRLTRKKNIRKTRKNK